MFQLECKDSSQMYAETSECFALFENISMFVDLQNKLYGDNTDDLCFGDYQIDAISLYAERKELSVRFVETFYDKNKAKTLTFFIFDFFGVEDFWCDIAPEHFVNDLYMQKSQNGRILFECDAGLKFSFESAKANRCWQEFDR